jgi:Fe-Mn family superoxide dismutase
MSNKISRRDALTGIAAAGAAVFSLNENVFAEAGQENAAPAFRGMHQIKPLTFDPAKLKGISEKVVRSHWENNYGGSVKALNVVEQRLAAMMKEKDLPAYIYGELKREELIRTGSVVLHENTLPIWAATAKRMAQP